MVSYSANDPSDYLAQLDPDWRRNTLLALRTLIGQLAPDWVEVIDYRMLGYGPPGAPTLHLNAQKHFVGLYVGDIARVDPSGTLLAGMDCGKGCVRFKRRDAVGDNVTAFLQNYIALKRAGVSLG